MITAIDTPDGPFGEFFAEMDSEANEKVLEAMRLTYELSVLHSDYHKWVTTFFQHVMEELR